MPSMLPQSLTSWFLDHLPVSTVLQSVAYLIFGLKEDILELGGTVPANNQLVLEAADSTHLDVSRGVCCHCRASTSNKEFVCSLTAAVHIYRTCE